MMAERARLTGLIAAPHTPFGPDGSLNLDAVEKQAGHLLKSRITKAFVGGTTGECHSLSLAERQALAQRWMEVSRGSNLQVIVHVGSNCAGDARDLAAQAGRLGALAIAAVAPSYFKPANTTSLVAWCEPIAAAAPGTPFYFYDIPFFTHVALPMPEFLARASQRIPNFAGIKFTNPDLITYQECVQVWGRELDILWGLDELLLTSLVFGGRGAVGATYNFAAPIYHRLMAAFERGDLETARQEQFRSVQLVRILNRHGFFGATKAVMKMAGVDVGPARPPNSNPSPEQLAALRHELEQIGFFTWIQP